MMEMTYPVAEKFISINGEGRLAGELSLFIRFRKCNLHCSYCDTRWANHDDTPAELMTIAGIADFAQKSGIRNITLTGGEPLLQNHLDLLITELIRQNHHVEIETNGSISIRELAGMPCRPSFTLDYKLPSSGMESHMCTENYAYLDPLTDVIKFVAGSREDLEQAYSIIQTYHLLHKCQVYFSPVFGKIEPVEIVEFMKEKQLNQVRLQLQLHKFIWNPEQGGV